MPTPPRRRFRPWTRAAPLPHHDPNNNNNNNSTMPPPQPSTPITASFPSSHLTIGAGAAIFPLASSRVVVCRHSRDGSWFLPKGRRDADESSTHAAQREGFEESGYANRVLPLPLRHRQTGPAREGFVTEPVWTQLMPVSATTQYLLFWYVAETVPSGAGRAVGAQFPRGMSLRERIALDVREDGEVDVPVRQEGTGVDEEELLYESFLLPVEEARRRLRGSVMEDVVARGWEAIQLRMRIEDERAGIGGVVKGG